MKKSKLNRRQFIKNTAVATLAVTGTRWNAAPAFLGANESKNDRIAIGCIGLGGMGNGDSHSASRFGEIVALCDVDTNRYEATKAAFQNGGIAKNAECYQDYRKLLDRKDVDVIIHATPDHWHTKINLDALQAGKDIYTEKPLTLTIDEGKKLCKAVKDTKRVLQTGTQQRSAPMFQTAVELVRNGRIGRLRQVWVTLPFFDTKGGPYLKEEIPAELDWDLYQGQAPLHDYHVNRTHSWFRWWYEYAGGITTDWGNHHMDIAHWGMDCELTGPISIEARGLFPNEGREHCYNTPDRFFSKMLYKNGVEMLFFCDTPQRNAGDSYASDEKLDWLYGKDSSEELRTYNRDGILFIGDKGRVFVNRGGVYGKPVDELAENPFKSSDWRAIPSQDHMGNFFEAVKNRSVPVAPVDIEHRSVSACHLTNISIRLGGKKLQWDPDKEEFVGNAEANAMLSRAQRAPYQF